MRQFRANPLRMKLTNQIINDPFVRGRENIPEAMGSLAITQKQLAEKMSWELSRVKAACRKNCSDTQEVINTLKLLLESTTERWVRMDKWITITDAAKKLAEISQSRPITITLQSNDLVYRTADGRVGKNDIGTYHRCSAEEIERNLCTI